jgi:hypothetical protein
MKISNRGNDYISIRVIKMSGTKLKWLCYVAFVICVISNVKVERFAPHSIVSSSSCILDFLNSSWRVSTTTPEE